MDLMRRLEENGRRLDRLRSEARVRVRPPRLAVVSFRVSVLEIFLEFVDKNVLKGPDALTKFTIVIHNAIEGLDQILELLPDHACPVNDGLYKAFNIFLKVHPNIKESERYRLCKTVNYQKLSQEAFSHAAQNERLPIQMAIQVLYFEQIRLRNAMNGNQDQLFFGSIHGQYPQRSGSGSISPRDNYASVRRENGELKLEVERMRMRLTNLEKDHVQSSKSL
ncbi:BTB/POZ domain-containing protein At1g03010-like [Asparagus officinalis]|uniref:BTB/POZ domain-containing protein At1g03010-like n=1 Tax=Asparagus officinalis TaxID=4686 RepID=UPI00098E52D5|nr:BTB/POZ domain-containing protein At1g03010-like [Asparagus officinalis]